MYPPSRVCKYRNRQKYSNPYISKLHLITRYDDLEQLEESLSSEKDHYMLNYKFSKAKKKFEEKQKARIEKTKRLIQRFYSKNSHNPNSPPEDQP